MKICSNCGQEKAESEFYAGQNPCKSCKKEYLKIYNQKNKLQHKENCKIYYQENKLKITAQKKIYYQKNKLQITEKHKIYNQTASGKFFKTIRFHTRRSRTKQSPCTLTLEQWNKILEHQKNRCAICGKRFCKSRPATKDHIVPLSRGGGLTFENVQALCKSCNSSKNASIDLTKIITWSHYGAITATA